MQRQDTTPTAERSSPRRLTAISAAVAMIVALGLSGCSATETDRPTTTAKATASAAPLTPASDHGPSANASGSAVELQPGRYTYTVASGDTVQGIAIRFGVCIADLYGSNTGLAPHEADLRIGEHLNVARVEGPDHEKSECLTGNKAITDYN